MGTLAQHATRYLLERRARQELSRASTMRISYTLISLDKSYGDRPLSLFGGRAIERWSEQNPHWARSTRNTYLSAAREFCRWLLRRKLIRSDPFTDITLPRRPRPSPRPLPRSDIARLLAAVPDARARLIVHLQWGLGLRCCLLGGVRRRILTLLPAQLVECSRINERGDAGAWTRSSGPQSQCAATYTTSPLVRP